MLKVLLREQIKLRNRIDLRFDENPGKSGKKTGNRINSRKRKSKYHIWEVNHSFCEEIWSKLLKYEDLRSTPQKNKKINRDF